MNKDARMRRAHTALDANYQTGDDDILDMITDCIVDQLHLAQFTGASVERLITRCTDRFKTEENLEQ